MTADELTGEDFTKHDLPDRPLRYRPEYQRNRREFALIVVAVLCFVGIAGLLSFLGPIT